MKKPTGSMTRGERVCAFLQRHVPTPEGKFIGQPMKLEQFQRDFILSVYDNPHGTHTAILSIGRRNGKTALTAGLLLAHLVGPEAIQNSQIASGARSKEQASVVFDLARKMIELSPTLGPLVRIMPSGKQLIGLRKNVTYKALAADGKTAMGKSIAFAILDELGQVVGPTDEFVNSITSSQGSYDNPLLIAISTQAPTANDLMSIWIDSQKAAPDPHVVCHVYSAPEGCKLDDREAWRAANPAMGVFRSEADIEKQVQAAMAMPANEPGVRNLILNQRCEADSPYVSKSIWDANGAPPGDIKGRKVWAGLDLSSVADLTALVAVDETGGVHPHFWLPHDGLREKAAKDRVPYDLWEREGLLHTTPGSAIEYRYIARFLRGFFDSCDVQAIGFDRALFRFLKPYLEEEGFTEEEIAKFIEFGQGTLSMTPALRELETRLVNKSLRHGGHKVLTMCAANAKVVGDSGARKFDKKRARGRIDGMVSLAMAVGVMPAVSEKKSEPTIMFL